MKKLTALFCLIFSLCSCHSPSLNQAQKLPFDPLIQRGQLANGLNYYVLSHSEPKNRVYIRLVVNAGSMHEDEDQKGIAHLVEHMAFNGSARFPENQIIAALEKLGMKFARDINAFTDFENTVYTLNLDKNDLHSLELAFDVINEWIHHLTILPQDLDNERGVVKEEWRRRLSPMLRLGDKKSAVEMAGSRYVTRDPIGDMNIIRHISRQRVMDFYKKWYRPDNVSLIVVGDVQGASVKKLIEQKLNIPQQVNLPPLEKIDFSIPLVPHWRFATVSEKGTYIPTLELSFFEPYQDNNTLLSYKQDLIQQILIRLLNVRLQQWEKNHKQVIETANFYRTHLGKETLQNVFILQLFHSDYENSLDKLFAFIAEIKQQGFSQQEFRQEIARLIELNEKEQYIQSGSLKLADDLIINVANNQIKLGKQDKYQINKKLLQDIQLSDIQQAFNQLINIEAKLLLITQPYQEKKVQFSTQKLAEKWQQSLATEQSPYTVSEQKVKMPDLVVNKGKIKLIKKWQNNLNEYQLSNGSRLIYYRSDKSANQVNFKAITSGGLRSVAKQDYHLFKSAVSLVDDSGIGMLTQEHINQLFAQNPIAFGTFLDDYQQGFTAVGKPTQLADLLKLFRLRLTQVKVSDNKLVEYQRETENYFRHIDKETEFMQKVSQLRYPNIPSIYAKNKAEVLSFTAKKLTDFYSENILNKTDFTYFIVGDISEDKVEQLAEQYLASVEVKQKGVNYYPVNVVIPKETFVMTGLGEPRAEVEIYLNARQVWQPELQYQLDILADILQEKLRLILREKESGIYAVNSWFTVERENNKIEGKIEFSCSPQRAKELVKHTHQVLQDIMQNGVEVSLLEKKIAEKNHQLKRQFDSLFSALDVLEQAFLPTSPSAVDFFPDLHRIATKQKIDQLAKQVLVKSQRFETLLLP